ncbi:MAG: hypothetical protein ICV56_05045 [Nitrososphaeraceae archaeon]|nr:hypothetical protein [Nitrososphaeraceae archaeon]
MRNQNNITDPAPGKPRILLGERKSLLIFIPSFVVTFTVLTVVSGLDRKVWMY